MNEGVAVASEVAREMGKLVSEAEKNAEAIGRANITEEDREFVRSKLVETAEHIRKKYGLQIPVISSFLHEMLDVSI